MSRRKPFWRVAPSHWAGVLVGTLASTLTALTLRVRFG